MARTMGRLPSLTPRSAGPVRFAMATAVAAVAVLTAGSGALALAPVSAQADTQARVAQSGVGQQNGVPPVIPAPTSLRPLPGQSFTLSPKTRVVVDGTARDQRVGDQLASLLRPATGYPFPVTTGAAGAAGAAVHSISLTRSPDLAGALGDEGYLLQVTKGAVLLRAATAEGLFHGVQTLRQLLPPRIEADTVQSGPWTVSGVHVMDKPRFGWRGAMLDPARHFLTVDEIKRYIDLLALYKVNTLHLHLGDDQGWRIEIKSWPRLATYGGSTEVGGGPGGFYTQREYADIVGYAAERFITVIPEIDMPSHTNAALASYAELNCDGNAPPLYTGTNVGFSSLCIDKPVTYEFVDDVVRELAAMTPGPYIHIGGDEAHVTPHPDYVRFINRVGEIVASHDKRMIGWEEISGADVPSSSVAQYWDTASEAVDAARKGMGVVMSPATKVYLDMKYNKDTPLGLTWAGFSSVRDSYEWDPGSYVDGLPESAVLGVEAPLWGETVENIDHVEFMAFPRMAGVGERGWSSPGSWAEYRQRLAAQGPRWDAMSVDYYRSPQVPWPAG